jgi:hypothetical protein
MYMKYSSVCSEIWKRGENVHEVQLCVVKDKKRGQCAWNIALCCETFTTHSCTLCTLSPLFYISLPTAVLHVHCPLFFMFHYTQLFFMYIVTSFLYFTTHSCTSCTLSPLFYVSLHTAVPHVHCHLFFMFHYTELYFMYIWKRGDNVDEVQLCVVKHKKEVTMCIKYSFVQWKIKKRWQRTWSKVLCSEI